MQISAGISSGLALWSIKSNTSWNSIDTTSHLTISPNLVKLLFHVVLCWVSLNVEHVSRTFSLKISYICFVPPDFCFKYLFPRCIYFYFFVHLKSIYLDLIRTSEYITRNLKQYKAICYSLDDSSRWYNMHDYLVYFFIHAYFYIAMLCSCLSIYFSDISFLVYLFRSTCKHNNWHITYVYYWHQYP